MNEPEESQMRIKQLCVKLGQLCSAGGIRKNGLVSGANILSYMLRMSKRPGVVGRILLSMDTRYSEGSIPAENLRLAGGVTQ